MRIHFIQPQRNQAIYGALVPTITGFKMHGIASGEKISIFTTTNFGDVYCTQPMLARIINRYIANRLPVTILKQGFLSNT